MFRLACELRLKLLGSAAQLVQQGFQRHRLPGGELSIALVHGFKPPRRDRAGRVLVVVHGAMIAHPRSLQKLDPHIDRNDFGKYSSHLAPPRTRHLDCHWPSPRGWCLSTPPWQLSGDFAETSPELP